MTTIKKKSIVSRQTSSDENTLQPSSAISGSKGKADTIHASRAGGSPLGCAWNHRGAGPAPALHTPGWGRLRPCRGSQAGAAPGAVGEEALGGTSQPISSWQLGERLRAPAGEVPFSSHGEGHRILCPKGICARPSPTYPSPCRIHSGDLPRFKHIKT